MTINLRLWLGSLAIGSLALIAGCAGTPDRSGLTWLNLPSPRATLKNTPARAAMDDAASAPKPISTKSATKLRKADDKGDKDQESVSMALLRGRNSERAGEWDKARQIYEGLRQKHPDNAEVAHRLGVVADAQRRHAEAEQLFLFGLQKEPRNATLLSDLGYCYFLQGQLSKAESAIRKATILEPSSARHSNNLGLVVGHQGRHEEALEHFRQAGSEADAHYNLAFVYAAQERTAEAKACFQEALAADPAHRRAREALASFEEYERLPKHLRDLNEIADSGVRYVPYIESADPAGAGRGVQVAGGEEGVSTSLNASRQSRALLMESRSARRNMASQRADDAAGP